MHCNEPTGRLAFISVAQDPPMARKARLHVCGGCYHVTLRGNHRQPIFFVDTDRVALESFVADAVVRHGAIVHAYCWMTNHIHLLVQVGGEPLGRIMQSIGSRYARHAQSRVETTGHLFERRYHALLVDTEAYLLTLVRYVHLNPVRGGLVADPADYRWSSHRSYLGLEARPWLDTRRTLGMLGASGPEARAAYQKFASQGMLQTLPSPIAAASRCDPRVLGDEQFVRRLPDLAPFRRTRITLDDLITQVCKESGINPADLAAPTRARAVTAVRAAILQRALDEGVATVSELARRFGRSAAAMCQLAARTKKRAATACSAAAARDTAEGDAGPETLKR